MLFARYVKTRTIYLVFFLLQFAVITFSGNSHIYSQDFYNPKKLNTFLAN